MPSHLVVALYCELYTECRCVPPCDYMETPFEPTPHCEELASELQELSMSFFPNILCLYTRSMGHGCDRCVALEMIAPSPCLEQIQPTQPIDLCEDISCPEGEVCDPTTGLCCDIETGCEIEVPQYDPCEYVTCEPGFVCEPSIGLCGNPDTDECAAFPSFFGPLVAPPERER